MDHGDHLRRRRALLLFFLWKYRHKEGREVAYTHGNNRIEVIWTIVPAVICVMLALMSRRLWADIKQNMPPGAMQIGIEAEQFAWNIHYPGPDGKIFTADDVVTFNQLHVPVGKPVVVTLRSKDVIHSFFLNEFRVKQDAVPGMTTKIWFEGTTVGHWEIACAELCGLGHYRMKGFITVDAPEEFRSGWRSRRRSSPSSPGCRSGGRRSRSGGPRGSGRRAGGRPNRPQPRKEDS